MIQRPSQEEIEKGLAEFKGDYKRLLRNITDCLEFDYKAICSLRTLLADSKEDIAEIKRTIRPYVVDLILAVRDTGETNMFDVNAVQYIANREGYYELVVYLMDNRKEYSNFIMTGAAPGLENDDGAM